jgi:uncharacterized protein YdaU (DUF1376 family)
MTRGEWKNQGYFIQKRLQESRRHILNNIKNAWNTNASAETANAAKTKKRKASNASNEIEQNAKYSCEKFYQSILQQGKSEPISS